MQQMSVLGAAMLVAVGTFPVFGESGIERPGSGRIGSSMLLHVTTGSLSRACPAQSGEALVHGIPGCVEEVSFQSGDLSLAGQWFTPHEAVAAVPAAVVVRGSGDSVRGNPWTESLVAVLLEAGFGVLVPDKWGSGHSEGDWRTAHFVDLAGDAAAAVHYPSGRLSWEAYADALLETRAIVGDRIVDEYFIHTRDHWRWDFFRRLEGFHGLGHDLMDHSVPGPLSEHGLRPDLRDTLADWAPRVAAR